MSKPPKRKADRRPTLTLKGEAFGPEFRALLNKAAKKAGKTQSAFAAEVLDREARRLLQSTPSDNPEDNPPTPAVLERIEATDQKIEATDARIAELADQMQRLTALQQRSLWQKVRAAFG